MQPTICESDLPECENCGDKYWCQGTYHDFYCGNCGDTFDIVFGGEEE